MLDSQSHPKMRFGVFEFNPRARELLKHGSRVRLQEQPLQVLTALLEQAGEVVPREELQRRLWPDGTFVDFDQSLNKAVNKLREALGDSADKPVYVETLARRGYRFIAPVVVEAPKPAVPEEPKQAPVEATKPARSRSVLWWGAGLAAAAVLVTGVWPMAEPEVRVTQLTSDGRSKNSFLVIAGDRVVYSAGAAGAEKTTLWSVSTAGGEPRREPSPCPESPYTVVWGGSQPRQRLLIQCGPADMEFQAWLSGFDGSSAQMIDHYHWDSQVVAISPDLGTLAGGRKDGLYLKTLADGTERRVVGPGVWNTGVSLPFWHPSGERIGFYRREAGRLRVWEVRKDGTELRPLAPGFAAEQKNGQWSLDGRRLYFTSQGNIYMQRGRGWLGWMRAPRPERLTSGPTRFGASYEDPANPLTVYAAGGNFHAAAMKLNPKTNAWEPFLDGAPVDCVSYSPDGQWIAYVSWPGGELWKCRRDGSGKVLLDAGLRAYNPQWSADGQSIIFGACTREVGGTAPPLEDYIIAAGGGKPERLPRVAWPNGDVTWAPDDKRRAFGLTEEEALRKAENPISILNQQTGKVEAVPGSKNLFAPHWSPDGKLLEATSFDKHSLYVYSFASKKWKLLQAGDIGFSKWSKDSRYIYCARGPEVKAILRVEVATGRAEVIRSLTEFNVTAVYWPGVYWTPEEEPVVLRSLASTQIYRIERDR